MAMIALDDNLNTLQVQKGIRGLEIMFLLRSSRREISSGQLSREDTVLFLH